MLCALMLPAEPTAAQASKGIPNALQGFSQNRNQPVQIEAATLEVRDRDKVATFSGGVNVTQGDTNMKAKLLVVYYDQEATPGAMKAATPGPQGAQQIRRLEAKGGVVVTQKDQIATGDTGIFDMRANTVTLLGNVTVSKGQNVMRGERLVVNLESGISTVEAGKSNGRVQMLINPNDASFKGLAKDKKSEGKTNTRASEAAKPAASRSSPIY
ncbi:MAG: LptA/OstA family protein [Pseudorhodoplanes sp.]